MAMKRRAFMGSVLGWLAASAMVLMALTLGVQAHENGSGATTDSSGSGSITGSVVDNATITVPQGAQRQAELRAALDRKAQLCARVFDNTRAALRLLRVRPESTAEQNRRFPRILCFVNTISVHHATRAQAAADTWGQRCDRLVFFSNATDTLYVRRGTSRERAFEVIKMDVPADHDHLWQKHKASLRYVYEHYRHDFDWFYKADDDAYVIVENLREYLRRPEIMMNHRRQPMQMGHRFNLTQGTTDYYIVDKKLKSEWWRRWDRWVFNSGGPGYVMNRLYLDRFVTSMREKYCLSDPMSATLPDDAAISYCMMWHDVLPWDTRDLSGRERWHADSPAGVYFTDPERAAEWQRQYHNNIGGMRWKDDCCAPDSIGFHYVKPLVMYHVERELYYCRTGDDVPTLEAFNAKFGLALGDLVVVHPDDVPKPTTAVPAALLTAEPVSPTETPATTTVELPTPPPPTIIEPAAPATIETSAPTLLL